MASLLVPDRDAEQLGSGGSAVGTLTPSSRRSSLVSGQLLYHPVNKELLEEPVEEQVSGLLHSIYGYLGPTGLIKILGPKTFWSQICN